MKKLVVPVVALLAAIGLAWTLRGIFYVTPLAIEPLFFNQKIFYWHVPNAFMLFVAVFVCGLSSAAFLKTRRGGFDDVALAGGELSVMLGAIVLATGSIWAKAAWGHWWVWDMRLTTSLLLWLVMVGYVIVRRFGGPGAERLSAGLAVFAMADVPLIYFSVKIWRTFHPTTDTVTSLDPNMVPTFLLSLLTFTLVFIVLLITRVESARSERQLRELHEQALDAGILDA